MTRQTDASAKVTEAFRVLPTIMMPVQQLNPAPYNPRKISPAKFDALKEGIRLNGFLEGLVIQKHSKAHGENVVVGGHQRIKAVKEICIEQNVPVPQLPCVLLDIDDRKAKILNIALNNVGGEFDAKLVGEVLEDINHLSVVSPAEKVLMGFEEEDFSKYMKFSEPPRVDADSTPIVGMATLRLEFKDKKTRDAVKEAIEKRAKLSRKQSGDVVFDLLGGAKRKK